MSRGTSLALCFEVRINDGEPVMAGLADIDVLSVLVSLVSARRELQCQVGGLVKHGPHDNEHVEWLTRELTIGDHISNRVVESAHTTDPVRRERADPEFVAQEERKYYELLKARYESK